MNSQNGRSWFLLTVLLAFFCWILLSRLFSERNVTLFVNQSLTGLRAQNASADLSRLKFSAARLYFSNGVWPEIGLELEKLEWSPKNYSCFEAEDRRLNTTADVKPAALALKTQIPIQFTSLLRGQMRGLVVRMIDVDLDIDRIKGCRTSNSAASATASNASSKSPKLGLSPLPAARSLGAGLTDRTFQAELLTKEEWVQLTDRLSQIQIVDLEAKFESAKKQLNVRSFEIEKKDSGFALASELQVPPETVFGEMLPVFHIQGQIENSKLAGRVHAELAEGRLDAVLSLSVVEIERQLEAGREKALMADVSVAVRDLPLSLLSPILKRSGLIGAPVNPKSVWLNCNGQISGEFQAMLSESPIALSGCQVYGNLGQIEFERGYRFPNGEFQFDRFGFKKIDLAALSRVFPNANKPALARYIVEPGIWTGTGEMDGEGLKALRIEVIGARVNPRNRAPSLHSVLSIPKLAVEVQRVALPAKYDFELKTVQLDQAELKGQTRGQFEIRSGEVSRIQTATDELYLNDKNALELLGVQFQRANQVRVEMVLEKSEVAKIDLEASVQHLKLTSVVEGIGDSQLKLTANFHGTSGESGRSDQLLRVRFPKAKLLAQGWPYQVLEPLLWTQVSAEANSTADPSTPDADLYLFDTEVSLKWVGGKLDLESALGRVWWDKQEAKLSASGQVGASTASALDLNVQVEYPSQKTMGFKVVRKALVAGATGAAGNVGTAQSVEPQGPLDYLYEPRSPELKSLFARELAKGIGEKDRAQLTLTSNQVRELKPQIRNLHSRGKSSEQRVKSR